MEFEVISFKCGIITNFLEVTHNKTSYGTALSFNFDQLMNNIDNNIDKGLRV